MSVIEYMSFQMDITALSLTTDICQPAVPSTKLVHQPEGARTLALAGLTTLSFAQGGTRDHARLPNRQAQSGALRSAGYAVCRAVTPRSIGTLSYPSFPAPSIQRLRGGRVVGLLRLHYGVGRHHGAINRRHWNCEPSEENDKPLAKLGSRIGSGSLRTCGEVFDDFLATCPLASARHRAVPRYNGCGLALMAQSCTCIH
jgi:hypothetical protein